MTRRSAWQVGGVISILGSVVALAFGYVNVTLAIAGAVLIHAACVLMAGVLVKGDGTLTIYALTRILRAA